jgi:hypothetical protein
LAAMLLAAGGCEWMSDYPKEPYATTQGVVQKSGPGEYGGTNIPDNSNNVLPSSATQAAPPTAP